MGKKKIIVKKKKTPQPNINKKKKWSRQERSAVRKQIQQQRGKRTLGPDEVVDAILSLNTQDPQYSLYLETIYKLALKHEEARTGNPSPPPPPLRIEKKEEEEGVDCSICYESLVGAEAQAGLFLCPKCNAVTHQSCVSKWHATQAIRDNRCPMCNT